MKIQAQDTIDLKGFLRIRDPDKAFAIACHVAAASEDESNGISTATILSMLPTSIRASNGSIDVATTICPRVEEEVTAETTLFFDVTGSGHNCHHKHANAQTLSMLFSVRSPSSTITNSTQGGTRVMTKLALDKKGSFSVLADVNGHPVHSTLRTTTPVVAAVVCGDTGICGPGHIAGHTTGMLCIGPYFMSNKHPQAGRQPSLSVSLMQHSIWTLNAIRPYHIAPSTLPDKVFRGPAEFPFPPEERGEADMELHPTAHVANVTTTNTTDPAFARAADPIKNLLENFPEGRKRVEELHQNFELSSQRPERGKTGEQGFVAHYSTQVLRLTRDVLHMLDITSREFAPVTNKYHLDVPALRAGLHTTQLSFVNTSPDVAAFYAARLFFNTLSIFSCQNYYRHVAATAEQPAPQVPPPDPPLPIPYHDRSLLPTISFSFVNTSPDVAAFYAAKLFFNTLFVFGCQIVFLDFIATPTQPPPRAPTPTQPPPRAPIPDPPPPPPPIPYHDSFGRMSTWRC